jgi:hypothetical protein
MEKTEQLLEQILKALKEQEDELLSPEDISKKYNINIQKVRTLFRDRTLPVMRNLKPQRILKSEWLKYLSKGNE